MVLRSLVGASVKRKEDPGLITGSGKYVGDIKLPGMGHVAFVRSPYAHAKILGALTPRRRKAREGVLAVVTGEDLRAEYEPVPMAGGDQGLEQIQPSCLVGRPRASYRRGGGGCHRDQRRNRARTRLTISRSIGKSCPPRPICSAPTAAMRRPCSMDSSRQYHRRFGREENRRR